MGWTRGTNGRGTVDEESRYAQSEDSWRRERLTLRWKDCVQIYMAGFWKVMTKTSETGEWRRESGDGRVETGEWRLESGDGWWSRQWDGTSNGLRKQYIEKECRCQPHPGFRGQSGAQQKRLTIACNFPVHYANVIIAAVSGRLDAEVNSLHTGRWTEHEHLSHIILVAR